MDVYSANLETFLVFSGSNDLMFFILPRKISLLTKTDNLQKNTWKSEYGNWMVENAMFPSCLPSTSRRTWESCRRVVRSYYSCSISRSVSKSMLGGNCVLCQYQRSSEDSLLGIRPFLRSAKVAQQDEDSFGIVYNGLFLKFVAYCVTVHILGTFVVKKPKSQRQFRV